MDGYFIGSLVVILWFILVLLLLDQINYKLKKLLKVIETMAKNTVKDDEK